jgi:maleylacetoacetate isomerase
MRKMQLYGHWRSLATYRLRVALNLKGIDAEFIAIDLLGKEHLGERYRAVNPQGLLPALVVDGPRMILFQSTAIIEYLDEIHPYPPLLPITDAHARARVRGFAQIVAADAHPLIVPRVRDYLQYELGMDEPARLKWIRYFGLPALEAIEAYLSTDPNTGRFCYGDAPTIGDIMLASHVIGMSMFGCDTTPYPRTRAVFEACSNLDAFASAHPLQQPGADAALVNQ